MRRTFIVIATVVASMALLGAHCDNDVYDQVVGGIDDSSPQARALISFTYPQVFPRETLINDRFTESAHIKNGLDEHATWATAFEPQLRRQLSYISALSTTLGIKFDPLGGLQGQVKQEELEQYRDLARLRSEIDLLKTKAELESLKAKLERMKKEGAEGLEGGEPGATGGVPGAGKTPDAPTVTAINTEVETALEHVLTAVTKLQSSLATVSGESTAEASPEEHYADLSAFRSMLRADLAAVELDDIHDLEGNGLYRLQFFAHIFPGENKSRLGLAQLTLSPPRLNDDDIRTLYFTWLAHLTSRLNLVHYGDETPPVPKVSSVDSLKRLGASTASYDVVELPIMVGGIEQTIWFAAMDGHKVFFDELLGGDSSEGGTVDGTRPNLYPTEADTRDWLKPLARKRHIRFEREREKAQCIPTLEDGSEEKETANEGETPAQASEEEKPTNKSETHMKAYERAQGTIQSILSVDAAVAGFEQSVLANLPSTHRSAFFDALRSRLKSYQKEVRAAEDYLSLWKKVFTEAGRASTLLAGPFPADYPADCTSVSDAIRRQAHTVPPRFCKILFGEKPARSLEPTFACGLATPTRTLTARGETYAYAAHPTERVQRLSTVASAVNSASLGLGLAATIPKANISLEGAVNRVRTAVGLVDAVERSPLVVAFASDAGPPTSSPHQKREAKATFGWVFGPRMLLNPSTREIEFKHRVAPERLFADVSLPSWWPRVTFEIESAWVANWDAGDTYLCRSPGGLANGASEHACACPEGERCKGRDRPQSPRIHQMSVRLPLSTADLDAFTDYVRSSILRQRRGVRTARIYHLEPQAVEGCGDVTFIIPGTDLWRNPKVYLRGQLASEVKVLPDMIGIAATFNLYALPRSKKNPVGEIVVVTARGSDSYPVKIDDCEFAPESMIAAEQAETKAFADVAIAMGKAEAAVKKAKAEANEAEAKARVAEIAMKKAEADLMSSAAAKAEMKMAEIEVKKAEAEARKAEAEVTRAEKEVKKAEAEARKAEAEAKRAEIEAGRAVKTGTAP